MQLLLLPAGGWLLVMAFLCDRSPEECEPCRADTPVGFEEGAVALANDVPYGLSASVWSRDVGRCHRVAARLEAGLVWVNCWMLRDLRTPLGGMKQSGLGREGGLEAMRFFTEAKNVCVSYE